MVTFKVADVEAVRGKLPAVALAESLRARLGGPAEAGACNLPGLVDAVGRGKAAHGLVDAVHAAFDQHRPLIVSPDDVWLCLAQGLASHVRVNADALRGRLVGDAPSGKRTLVVTRHEFVMGSPANDWQGVFAELTDQIAAHVGKKRDLVVAGFSTTGPIERAASQVVLFDVVQSYFDFELVTLCGIPEVTLAGTVDDWESIRARAMVLGELDLKPWVNALRPVLDQLVATARGQVDRDFWRSFYKLKEQSGGPYMTGWINTLLPYIEEQDIRTGQRTAVPNAACYRWQTADQVAFGGGPAPWDLPCGLATAPFNWIYEDAQIPMAFHGGFVGVGQDADTGAVRPAIGWAVAHAANPGPAVRHAAGPRDRR